MSAVRLTLITRQDCHLCEEMAAVIEAVRASLPAELETLDVDADPELRRLYTDEVPVLLINGRKAFKYRVSRRELERRLRAEQGRDRMRGWRRRRSGETDPTSR